MPDLQEPALSPPIHHDESEEDESTSSPPPKRRTSNNRERTDEPVNPMLGTPAVSNQVSVVRLANNADENIENPNKLSLIEKMDYLLDEDSFIELMSLDSDDSIVVGEGKIDGKKIMIYSHRLVAPGHSMLKRQNEQIIQLLNHASLARVPIVGIEDFDGVINEDKKNSEFDNSFLHHNEWNFERGVPYFRLQINGENVNITNTCDMPLADFLFVVGGTSQFFSNEKNKKFTHRVFHHSFEAKQHIRELFNLLQSSSSATRSSFWTSNDSSLFFVKSDFMPCEIKSIIHGLVDKGRILEIQPQHAMDIVVGFSQIEGRTFGIFANNPNFLRCWGDDARSKGEEFLGFCSRFKIPLIVILDTPTFLADFDDVENNEVRYPKLYNCQEAAIFVIIAREGYEDEDDEIVSEIFPCNKTFIWSNELSDASEEPNIETIPPFRTRQKICDFMRTLEQRDQNIQENM